MSERSTFSPFWHRVRTMKPRLRPHVQITRQHFRGNRWHVVQDPTANAFFRINPVAYEFVGLLDGRRTVEEVWQQGLTRHGDQALTQNDVISVLSQLFSSNLLKSDLPTEAEQLLGRGAERTQRKALSQAIGIMYLKLRLVNPDRLLQALLPFFRPCINRTGFIAWCLLILAALAALVPHWHALTSRFAATVAPSNWLALFLTFTVLKVWHELGHGLICRRYGGAVPEAGVMLLVLIPAPYVDTSSSWGFADKWKRIAVGAGGMIFELAAAAVAALVWIATRDNPGLLHGLAYNVMLTSGVSTVLFNANPLMKFDGYYMLSDWLEIPNLMPRSQQLLKFLAQRNLFGVENANSPTSDPGEAMIMLVYGIAAMIYRVLIFLGITLYIMGKFFGIGLLLAIWTAAMWFILPLGSLLKWLSSSTQLHDKRPRAVLTTLGLAAAGFVLLGLVPFPDHRRAQGVVEAATRSGIYAGVSGFLDRVEVKIGQRVEPGGVIATLANPDVDALHAQIAGELAEALAVERRAVASNPGSAMVAASQVTAIRERLAYIEKKRDALTVRAPHAGTIVLNDPGQRLGAFVQEGEFLCAIVDESSLRVAAALPQTEADWISSIAPERLRVEGRRNARVHDVVRLMADRLPVAARRELPHPSLGFAGGGTIETNPDDQSATESKRGVFNAHFVTAEGTPAESLGVAGERIHLRFRLPSRPLLAQWWGMLDKTLQGRARL
jgi:putative peptide zinc metalloprotease protein